MLGQKYGLPSQQCGKSVSTDYGKRDCNVQCILHFRLLFHTSLTPPAVHKSNLDGRDLSAIVKKDLSKPWALDIDYPNKRLFWGNFGE